MSGLTLQLQALSINNWGLEGSEGDAPVHELASTPVVREKNQGSQLPSPSPQSVANLKRVELQAMAKNHGIRANQKSEVLISALQNLLQHAPEPAAPALKPAPEVEGDPEAGTGAAVDAELNAAVRKAAPEAEPEDAVEVEPEAPEAEPEAGQQDARAAHSQPAVVPTRAPADIDGLETILSGLCLASNTQTEQERQLPEETETEQAPSEGRVAAPKVRDYQKRLVDEFMSNVKAGEKSRVNLVYLPTGGGKTVVACSIIKRYILIVCVR
jgi:hypothetical protein